MKTVIVTGANGNLGQAVVKKFLDKGDQVIGTIRKKGSALNFSHENFHAEEIDLMNETAVLQFVDQTTEKYAKIDVAVLTAGGFAMGNIDDTSTLGIVKQFNLNFVTAYQVARPVFEQMKKQNGGRIFLIGSKPGMDMKNSKGMVAYGLSKSLLFRLAELMNEEGRKNNVITTVIVPSTIDTAENREAMPDADYGKWVKPEEIAAIIYFYCSEESAVIREPVIKVYNNA